VLAPEIPMKGGAFADLRAFESDLHDAVAADALKRNAPRVEALSSLHDLSAVTVESHGCYGPCGVYTLTFARTGAAAIVWATPPGLRRSEPYTVRSRAPANWDAVIAALHAAYVERLEPRYEIRAIDTASATLRFRFRTWTYRGRTGLDGVASGVSCRIQVASWVRCNSPMVSSAHCGAARCASGAKVTMKVAVFRRLFVFSPNVLSRRACPGSLLGVEAPELQHCMLRELRRNLPHDHFGGVEHRRARGRQNLRRRG
jgi:hypothetical protein